MADLYNPKAVVTYNADGVIPTWVDVARLVGSAQIDMTLPAPDVDGHVIYIYSSTAFTHTVTVSGGVNGGGAASDVGTFGGAVGDGVTLIALNGVWTPIASTNVTFA